LTPAPAPDSAKPPEVLRLFFELGFGAAVAILTSLVACRLLITAGLEDAPNVARKAHRNPTPTSGGLGIALGFGAGLLVVTFLASSEWRAQVGFWGFSRLSIVTAFACAFLGLGALDDARPMGPKLKFAIFAALSIGSALAVSPVTQLQIGPWVLHLGFVLGVLGSGLFVFTLVNCVNFMDGLNGLAMGSVSIGLAVLGAISVTSGAAGAASVAFCGAGALAGFLVWNFPNGRLFAGDSGALFAGALAALASLLALHRAQISPFIPPILFFPLLADTLLTLAWRVRNKRRIMDGHAEHMYQVLFRGGLSGKRVTLIYWVAMATCGVLGFIAARLDASNWVWNSYAPAITLALLAVVSLGVSAAVRGSAKARQLGEV
jgi:UDP-GlcNAc:undecaprenyl-phosphate GlcNAc-1-phosphate transferase